MGSASRDFRGNEMEWILNEPDMETRLSMIENYYSNVENTQDYHKCEAENWQDILDELDTMRRAAESQIDAENDEGECRYCDEPAVINGLCGDCNKMEESKQPEEGTLAYFMQYRGRD